MELQFVREHRSGSEFGTMRAIGAGEMSAARVTLPKIRTAGPGRLRATKCMPAWPFR